MTPMTSAAISDDDSDPPGVPPRSGKGASSTTPANTPSAVLQEALGVTPSGTCLRHPNCPVLSLAENRVMSCRVCFSEEKSVGIRQGKNFSAVVNQLQRMVVNEDQPESKEDGGGAVAAAVSSSETGKGGAASNTDTRLAASLLDEVGLGSKGGESTTASMPYSRQQAQSMAIKLSPAGGSSGGSSSSGQPYGQRAASFSGNKRESSSLAQQPQTLESIMKRLAQVQNWMLRQKEKEVLSLQLNIHRLEQRLKDSEQTVQDQKATIKQLRRTIQQDLKIIKTMATQKEREMAEEQQQQQQQQTLGSASSPGPASPKPKTPVPMGALGGPTAAEQDADMADQQMMLDSPLRKTTAATSSGGSTSPSKKTLDAAAIMATGISPLKAPSSSGAEPEQPMSQLEQMRKLGKSKNLMAGGGTSPAVGSMDGSDNRRIQTKTPQQVMQTPIQMPFGPSPGDDDDSDDSDDDQNEIYVPAQQRDKGGGNPSAVGSTRSSDYWNDADVSFATDPSRIFASFRGGLLDIPKSPPKPPGHDVGNKKKKLKLKIKLDKGEKQALKLPSIRNVARSHSGISVASTDTAATGDGGPPLTMLASQLQSLPLVHVKGQAGSTPGTPTGVPPPSVDQAAVAAAGAVAPQKSALKAPPLDGALQKMGSPATQASSKATDRSVVSGQSVGGQSTVTATYSVETLMSGDTASKSASTNTKDDKFLFSVTRAACQDKYGDPGMYTGTILVTEGLPHGKGTMNYESGRVYEGEWLSGHWNGKGSLLNPNGDTYKGEFVFDARHGQGVYKWDNGDVYVGSFCQDKRHGQGKFSFHNGNVYEGEFCDGMFEGFGRYEFDGGYYEGEWKLGRYDGTGELKYANGGKYTGEFRNSVAHGFGMEVTADGGKRRGVWQDGQPVQIHSEQSQQQQTAAAAK